MRRLIVSALFLISISLSAYQMDTLVDAPTAGLLNRGEASLFCELYKENGLLMGMRLGLFKRFAVGMSYGAENIVGNEKPGWHDRVEFHGKFRLMDETYKLPSIAVGFDTQGHGVFNSYKDSLGTEIRRYDIKSKGFFLVLSKGFSLMGDLGLHLGCNYSLEDPYEQRHINIFTGIDKMIGDVVKVALEYDMAINDDGKWLESTMEENIEYMEKGYLNAGVGIFFSSNLYVQLKFNDLLGSRGDTKLADRALTLRYYFDYRDDNK